MTVNALYKQLGQAIATGHGRDRVCVHKTTFTSRLELDGGVIIDVDRCDIERVPLMDGDGGTATTADGRERSFRACVLRGDNYDPTTGEAVAK